MIVAHFVDSFEGVNDLLYLECCLGKVEIKECGCSYNLPLAYIPSNYYILYG